jgi:hypothetical protein
MSDQEEDADSLYLQWMILKRENRATRASIAWLERKVAKETLLVAKVREDIAELDKAKEQADRRKAMMVGAAILLSRLLIKTVFM